MTLKKEVAVHSLQTITQSFPNLKPMTMQVLLALPKLSFYLPETYPISFPFICLSGSIRSENASICHCEVELQTVDFVMYCNLKKHKVPKGMPPVLY